MHIVVAVFAKEIVYLAIHKDKVVLFSEIVLYSGIIGLAVYKVAVLLKVTVLLSVGIVG